MCPKCGHGVSYVRETRRVGEKGHALKRTRTCEKCSHRFVTYEIDGAVWSQINKRVVLPHTKAVLKKTALYWRDQDIVRRVQAGEKRYLLAEEYGLSPNMVSTITRRAGLPSHWRPER